MFDQYSVLGKVALRCSSIVVPRNSRRLRQIAVNGFDMLMFVNEDVGRLAWLFGTFEEQETVFFQQQIRPDDLCLDVGGNLGYFSLLMARTASEGSVHVFEPIPLNAALIETNAQLNDIDNIVVNRCGVSDQVGETEFSVAVDSAYSSMHASRTMAESRRIAIRLETIDAYCSKHALSKVDIVKVDVEGAEALVIEGATDLFTDKGRRPRLVMLELYDSNLAPFGSSVLAIVKRMQEFGYQAHVLRPGKTELSLFTPQSANVIYNVFFTPM